MNILEMNGISKRFGGITAVENFSLQLPDRVIYGIIGPNGAGKTTIFNIISGIYHADAGRLSFSGKEIGNLPQYQIARLGIGRTFQNIRLFRGLTMLENILAALDPGAAYNLCESLLFLPRKHKIEKQLREKAFGILELFDLADFADTKPESLPYGLRRRLEIARAMAGAPKVLLLDEPGAGLNPKELADLNTLILKLHEQFAMSILLIEHRMEIVMRLCQRIYVQNFGKTLATGTPAEIQGNPDVVKAYLGEEE